MAPRDLDDEPLVYKTLGIIAMWHPSHGVLDATPFSDDVLAQLEADGWAALTAHDLESFHPIYSTMAGARLN